MLFLSRKFYQGDYGVVDTDDDVETVATYAELHDAITDKGLHIEGVVPNIDRDGNIVGIRSITPYQDPRYRTSTQLKWKALMGVDVRVLKDEITYLGFNGKVVPNNTRVRLSDFGKKMHAFVPMEVNDFKDDNCVIIVLDNKIEIVEIPRIGYRNIKWDVSECRDDVMVRELLRYFFMRGNSSHLHFFLIDTQERVKRWYK